MIARRSAAILLSGIFLLGGMSLVSATPPSSEQVSTSQSSVTLSEGKAEADTQSKVTREKLNSMKGKQPQSEIKAILDSNRPADVLYDPEKGEYVAAMYSASITPYLSIVGPGCTSSSACLRNTSNTPFGLQGTGSLVVNLKNITQVSAGSNVTGIWMNSTRSIITNAYRTTYLTSPTTVWKVTRT